MSILYDSLSKFYESIFFVLSTGAVLTHSTSLKSSSPASRPLLVL